MLRSKAYRKRVDQPAATLDDQDESPEDDRLSDPPDGFDPHSFCHDPVYRRLLADLLAEQAEDDGEDDDPGDVEDRGDGDIPLRLN